MNAYGNPLKVLGSIFQKLWRHSWRNWGLLLYAGGLTVCIRVGLSISSLSPVARRLRLVATGLPQRTSATPQYRIRASWAARAAGQRLLPKRPCLTQALVLQYLLLRRRDDAAELHIGVTKDDGNLYAHAWIEREGHVLIGGARSPERYECFGDLGPKIEPVHSTKTST